MAQALEETAIRLGKEAKDVIEDLNEFSDIGYSNWDIVDTGRLRDSMVIRFEWDDRGASAELSWDPVSPETGEHYAAKVWVGFVGPSGRLYPGRDWPGRAAERMNPFSFFMEKVKVRVQ